LHEGIQRSIRPPLLALAAGVATAALLWRTPIGLSWLVFVLVFVAVCLRRLGARSPTLLATTWAAAAVALAAALCWRASAWTLAIAFPASLAMLVALPMIVHRRLSWHELDELPALCLAWLFGMPAAVPAARAGLPSVESRGSRRVLAGIAIGGPISLVATLLLSANPRFVTLVGDVFARAESAVSFALWAVCAAAVYGVGRLALGKIHCGVLERLRNPAWLGRMAVPSTPRPRAESPYRATEGSGTVVERVERTLPPLTWAVVLGQLTLVFGLFVVANFDDLFGGHDLVRDIGTATYAQHLHAGFASVTAATVLAAAVVIFGQRVTVIPRRSRAARLLCALEVVLLALTAITLASCWQRTTIYMDAYGYTHQRIGVVLIQIVVLALLALTLVRAVLRGWRGFGIGLVALPVVTSLGAAAFDADLFVARANLHRLVETSEMATSSGLDERYLEQLSPDALPALADEHVPAELAERLEASWLERAVAQSCGDWRGWRGLGRVFSGSRPSPRASCSPSSESF
jgi:hypothetical protein